MRRLITSLLVVYALLTAYTILGRFFGTPFNPLFTPLLTLLAFLIAVLHGSVYLGWWRALLLLGLTFSISLLFESVGVATGLVYGPYHYTDQLGSKFLGLVPLLIPFAWFMMSYPSYVIAERLVSPSFGLWSRRLLVAGTGALVMTAWDLAMDPLMVAGGHWVWERPGAFFGVPLQNYWGWWLTVFTAFLLFTILGRRLTQPPQAMDLSFLRLAMVSYAITGLSAVIADLQSGLGGPATAGFFAMLPWVALAWGSQPAIPVPQRT